jgi:hypothetical protein
MKGRKGKANGGETMSGVASYKADLADKPMRYNNSKVMSEAEQRKHGGKAEGKSAKKHAGRMARKSGGRTGSNMNPLSSAAAGTPAKGRHVG